MSNRRGQIFALALGLCLALALSTPARASWQAEHQVDRTSVPGRVEQRPLPGPIEPGFRGRAYAVPAHPVVGTDRNAVPVTLRDENGADSGTAFVRAGRPLSVEAPAGRGGTARFAERSTVRRQARR
jgi:hypothetical protein